MVNALKKPRPTTAATTRRKSWNVEMESSSEAVSGYVSDGAKRRVICSQLFVNRGSEFAATEPRRIVNRESLKRWRSRGRRPRLQRL